MISLGGILTLRLSSFSGIKPTPKHHNYHIATLSLLLKQRLHKKGKPNASWYKITSINPRLFSLTLTISLLQQNPQLPLNPSLQMLVRSPSSMNQSNNSLSSFLNIASRRHYSITPRFPKILSQPIPLTNTTIHFLRIQNPCLAFGNQATNISRHNHRPTLRTPQIKPPQYIQFL